MRIGLIIILLWFSSMSVFGQRNPDDKFFSVDDAFWSSTFPNLEEHDLISQKISIDPKLVVEIFKETKTFRTSGEDSREYQWWGRVRLGKNSQIYNIISHPNGQNFTDFELFASNSNRMPIDASTFIPGNGFVYTFRRGPGYFGTHLPSKFEVKSDAVVEVNQPFYAYERDVVAGADFDIFADTNLKVIVAHVVKGSTLRLLGVTGRGLNLFLVKTPSGLLGWHELKLIEKKDMYRSFTLSSFDGEP